MDGRAADDVSDPADDSSYDRFAAVDGPSGPYLLLYRGSSYPVRAWSVLANETCTFKTTMTWRWVPATPRFKAVRRRVASDQVRGLTFHDLDERLARLPAWASFDHDGLQASVDFANDGRPILLARLEDEGGSRFCEKSFFDAANDARDGLAPEPTRRLLARLQGDDERVPGECRNASRWFRDRGITYFERVPLDEARSSEAWYRTVVRAERGKVVPVCLGAYRSTVRRLRSPSRGSLGTDPQM